MGFRAIGAFLFIAILISSNAHSQGLVAHYPFNSNATDESGNANHGSITGAVLTTDRFGNASSAFAFDGSSYITVANSASLQLGLNWTMAAWFSVAGPSPNDWIGVVSKAEASPSGESGPKIMLDQPGHTGPIYFWGIPLTEGSWYFAVIVASGDSLRGYLNSSPTGPGDAIGASWTFSNSNPLTLGGQNGSFWGRNLNGTLDDVMIFGRALTSGEIDSLYHLGGWGLPDPPNDLVAFYPCDGSANDMSGNGNHGSVLGATLTADRFGIPNSAYSLDGVSDFIDLPESPSLTSFGDQLTIAGWVYMEGYPADNWATPLLNTGHQNDYFLGIYDDGRLLSHLFLSSGPGEMLGNEMVQLRKWTHVAMTYNGSVVTFYINGSLDSVFFRSGAIGGSPQPENVAIGAYMYNGVFTSFLPGVVDDIHLFSRALAASEIDSLYRLGGWPLPQPPEELTAYYPFTGNADDSSGNGRHGVVTGAALAADRFGTPNSAYRFDGQDDYIVAGGQPLLNNNFSYSAWISVEGNNNNRYIQSFGVLGPEPNHVWNFAYRNLGGSFDLWDATNSAYYLDYPQPDSTLPWTLVTIVYADGEESVYVNDALWGTRTVTLPIADAGGRTLLLGILRTDFLGDQRFNGRIDDVRLFGRALSANEVDSLYHLGGWPLRHSTIVASDACGDTIRLELGLAPLGTDCIDPDYGERDLPPVPPGGGFDARFLLPCDSASLRDFRSDLLTTAKWKLRIQACSLPLTLSWNTTAMPSGYLRMRDPFGGLVVDVDMKAQTSLTITNPALTELHIFLYQDECHSAAVREGWNMVSSPLNAPRHFLELFPTAVTSPYLYNAAGYVEEDTLTPGTGYWLKFADSASVAICGTPALVKNIPVVVGWNMIGAFDDSVATASITSTPAGILGSPFYSYAGTYQTPAVLIPGQAYWVRANQPGTVHLGGMWKGAGSAWKPEMLAK